MQRLSDQELLVLLNNIESDHAERKKPFEAVCAFAKDLPGHNQPGVLFIGANDDGTPSGMEITDQLLRSLAYMKTDGNIMPFPVFSEKLAFFN